MAKMWAGRFSKEADAKLDSFNTSLPFDCRMYAQDIQGSLAHSEMLEKQGIISKEDKEAIHKGLKEILTDIESNELTFSSSYEDIHMFIEADDNFIIDDYVEIIGDNCNILDIVNDNNYSLYELLLNLK